MAARPKRVVWRAEPHTLAKIAILKSYLHAYFPILGRSKHGKSLVYVDGFAGPGEYSNSPQSSPVAALTAARSTISKLGADWRAGTLHCVFVEEDSPRCNHLRRRVQAFDQDPRLTVDVLNMSFVKGIEWARDRFPSAFLADDPLFVFVDPFGATGVPFATISQILNTRCSEVLINFDADGIARIRRAEDRANAELLLKAVFGDNSWMQALTSPDFSLLCRQTLNLYKEKLRALPAVRYVFSFEMRDASDTLNYFLVFASRHPLGLEKMKEAMGSIDQTGTYLFSDGGVGQDVLYKFDDPKVFGLAMHTAFVGSAQRMQEIADYALNETPFPNPKSMLRVLEKEDLIEVTTTNPKRRRGVFGESVISIKFLKRVARSEGQGRLFDGY